MIYLWLRRLILVGLLLLLMIPEVSAVTETVLDEGFENGLGNWSIVGISSTNSTIYYSGTNSLSVGDGYIQKKYLPLELPNKTLNFSWYQSNNNDLGGFAKVLILGEGSFTTTDEVIQMFANGSYIYFKTIEYKDGIETQSSQSNNTQILLGQWYNITIDSNITNTTILINNQPVNFGTRKSSYILTNVFDWVVFNSIYNVILDDDGVKEQNTGYINNGVIRYQKNISLAESPNNITTSQLSFYFDKDALLTGSIYVTLNGNPELNLTDDNITSGTSNPLKQWYTFDINKSNLTQGNNTINLWGIGTTTTVLEVDTSNTTINRSARSTDSGNTYNYTLTPSWDGEYMIRLHYTPASGVFIDNINISTNPVRNSLDLFGRTFDGITAASPSGNNKIQAIYAYLLTRNLTYLSDAETGAESIQNSYNSGNKNLNYIKEVAILSLYNVSRTNLLNQLAEVMWEYKVNKTTNLTYYVVNSAGTPTNLLTITGDIPDALSDANSFLYAYEATGNSTYLNRSESMYGAIYHYMRHPTYNTIITSVNATNGTSEGSNRLASRGGDQIASFIENSLFLYKLTNNQTYLNWSIYQYDQYNAYAWDVNYSVYRYDINLSPPNGFDEIGYEDYVPSMTNALIGMYEATGNSTYLTKAENNYLGYLTYFRRNGLTIHYFLSDGRFGHDYAHFMYDIPRGAGMLYKHTQNQTYLNLSENYTRSLLTDYYGTNSLYLYSASLKQYAALDYLSREMYAGNVLYQYILPTSNVNISWAFGYNLFGRYRGITSVPLDVYFSRSGVTLLNVSGNGTIKFYKDITNANITSQNGSIINFSMLDDKLQVNPSGSGTMNVSVSTWNISGDYRKVWTESSSNASATTQHTIGDLPANTQIQINRDGASYGVFLTNTTGYISFTYTGGYSEHQFEASIYTPTQTLSKLTLTAVTSGTSGNSIATTSTTGNASFASSTLTGGQNGSQWSYTANNNIVSGVAVWGVAGGLLKATMMIVIAIIVVFALLFLFRTKKGGL